MADPNCCDTFGGRISIEIGGQRFSPTEADIKVDRTNFQVEAKANQDGSPCFMQKPQLYGAEITLRNPCGIVWNDVMRRCKVNATIVEEDSSRTHLFTGARITGKPTANLSTGEVSGLKIEGSRCQVV